MYRSLLWDLYKVHSSKELLPSRRESLIKRLVSELRQPPFPLVGGEGRQSKTDSHSVSDKQVKLILFLGAKHCTSLPAFCKKITGRDANPQNLTKLEGIKVIDALKRYERTLP